MSETMRGGRFASLVRPLIDLAIVRLTSIAAHMEQEIRGGNLLRPTSRRGSRVLAIALLLPSFLAQRDGLLDL
jgi:hypothetical protein